MQNTTSVTVLLGMNMFFLGIVFVATLTSVSVVGVETLGISTGVFAAIVAVGAVLGTGISLTLGYLSDKLPDRRVLILITAISGMAGHGLIYFWPTQAGFAIAIAFIMPLGSACFSQSFAYVRVFYAQHRPARADVMVTALRTVFTLAWVVVPPVAGWVAAEYGIFNVYLASAVSYAVVGGIFMVLIGDGAAKVQMPPPPIRREGASFLAAFNLPMGTLAGLCGLIVMTMAQRILTFTVPLFIVSDLGGTLKDVGIYAAITAASEVPCMMLLAYLVTRLTKETLLVAAGLAIALFLALTGLLTDLTTFYWLLILNGLGTAALMSINISYVQEAIKGRVGLSTSLMDVVATSANLLGASAFGLMSAGGDYRLTLMLAAAIAIAGAAILALGNLRNLGPPPAKFPVT